VKQIWVSVRPYLGALSLFAGVGALLYGWINLDELHRWLFSPLIDCGQPCSARPAIWMCSGFVLLVLAFKSGAIRKDYLETENDEEKRL
jgi:hypothetical protein